MGADRDLIAHCARQDKERGFMASKIGNERFEGLSSWIFGENVVKESTILDSPEHRWCGRGSNIAAKVEGSWAWG